MKGLYGKRELTARERRVVKLVAEGLSNKEVAARYGTTEHVIKNYLRTIFDKTGMSTRLELVLWYLARTENKDDLEKVSH